MTYDKKRWFLISATAVAFVVVVWQIHAMLSSDFSSPKPAVHATIKASTNKHASSTLPVSTIRTHQKTPVYVQLAREIELAKMHRQLLEQRVAIARAQQRLASMNAGSQSVSSLGTMSTESLGDNTSQHYQLLSLSKQPSRGWEAMMKVNGQLITAHVNQRLPNGDEVIYMGHDQVWVDQHQQAVAVSFDGEKPLSLRAVNMARKIKQVSTPALDPAPKKNVTVMKEKSVLRVAKQSLKISFGDQRKANKPTVKKIKKHTVKKKKQTNIAVHTSRDVALNKYCPAWMNPVSTL